MTARDVTQTTIVTKVIAHYEMTADDVRQLYEQIKVQIEKTYLQTIQAQLNLRGCQKLATLLDQASRAWIEDKARTDAAGIAKTYNRELANKTKAIYSSNKRTNRYGYMRALDTWLLQRNAFKVPSISLNTMTQARAYAEDRFIRENKIKGRFAPVGPPPVCKLCIRVFALGPLTWEECQKPRNKFPQHPGCPHKHAAMVITPINCAEAWTG